MTSSASPSPSIILLYIATPTPQSTSGSTEFRPSTHLSSVGHVDSEYTISNSSYGIEERDLQRWYEAGVTFLMGCCRIARIVSRRECAFMTRHIGFHVLLPLNAVNRLSAVFALDIGSSFSLITRIFSIADRGVVEHPPRRFDITPTFRYESMHGYLSNIDRQIRAADLLVRAGERHSDFL